MAFKLSKDELKRRDDYVKDLNYKWLAVQEAIEQYNERTAALQADVDKAVEEYNETLNEARGFVEDIASEASDEIDDKSEKWQESEKAEAAIEWKDAWEMIDLEEITINYPNDLEIESVSHADDLEALPEAAD
jgi:hypothetical protein